MKGIFNLLLNLAKRIFTANAETLTEAKDYTDSIISAQSIVGETSGWNWIKYENGIAIATFPRYSVTFPANTASVTKTVSLPFSFVSIWTLQATLWQNTESLYNAGVFDLAYFQNSNTTFVFRVFHNTQQTLTYVTTPQYTFLVVGKWK